jgi:hypothetical protein
MKKSLNRWLWKKIHQIMNERFMIEVEFIGDKRISSTLRVRPILDKVVIDWDKKTIDTKYKK